MSVSHHTVVLLIVMVLTGAASASGQNNRFTERSFVPSPSVRAMGDAGVALSGPDRPFFYNPAQLPHISSYFTVVGVQASANRTLKTQIDFYNRRLQPAIESNFSLGNEALEDLFRDSRRLGHSPARGEGSVVLPSFVYSTDAVGIGGGIFAKTALNYRVNDSGVGVPDIFLLSRTDVMALASLGVDLSTIGLSGLSVGVTATRTRRFLAFENKPLDTFGPDETVSLLQGNTFQVDVGGLYTPSWGALPGTFTFGGAVYDLLADQYDYVFEGASRMPFLDGLGGGGGKVEARTAAREAEQARRWFRLERSYRIGVAYRLESLLFLEGVGVAVDYQGYREGQQHPLARLHMGIRTRLSEGFVLRGGLSSGYPTGGVGFRLGALAVDYALHAFEEGRVPGQLGTYVHTARFTLRIQ